MVLRRRSLLATLAVALLAAGLWSWLGYEPKPVYGEAPGLSGPLPRTRLTSLLALGDTGRLLPGRPFGEGQRSVARGLVAEDRRAPISALLLLGDNFYPDGLERRELVERIRANLARPYCRFAELTGPRSPELAEACPLPPEQRRPVPILAVLGNHDHKDPESPQLQQEEIPKFLPNWSLSRRVDVVELGSGVSLIRADSGRVRRGGDSAEELRDAIDRAPGPWRILAVHEPISVREGRRPGAYEARMREALSAAREPVQLVLSGHDHNLQVIALDLARPALQVISGGGASRRPLKQPPYAGRLFGDPDTGFARVDLLGEGSEQGLLISLYTMPRYPIVFWREPRLVSRYWLLRSGRVLQVYPAPKSRESASSSESTG